MGRFHQHCQVTGPDQCIRLLYVLGADLLVCVHHRDQSLPVEVAPVCLLRYWEESTWEDRGTGGPIAEWARL